MTLMLRLCGFAVLAATMLAIAACDMGGRRNRDLPDEPTPGAAIPRDTVLVDTVGSQTLIGSANPVHVRGYGLVVGLGENGGSDCPTIIRDHLLDVLSRQQSARGPSRRRTSISPQRLIDSLDTAVVVVHGLAPAGAPRGARFDLQLESLGTQTRSLQGGLLLPCELRRFEASAVGKELVTGPAAAVARGMVFTQPSLAGGVAQPTQRRGYVLGGAYSVESRTVRLLLQDPSYWLARKIEQRLNERFSQNPPTAEAASKGFLTLATPPRYADRPAQFIELATHVFLENTPELIDHKLAELSQQLNEPESTLHHVSLVWEGMGRSVAPKLQPLYSHENQMVRYYAARAGLRLLDVNALEPIARIAGDRDHPRRLDAIFELGNCEFQQAAHYLTELLNDNDDQVRILAYEAILHHQAPAVQTIVFRSSLDPGLVNVALDIVDSNGSAMIYARRTLEPRIAIFGRLTPMKMPLFYNHPDDLVTLNALDARGEVSVLWRTRLGRQVSDPIKIPPRVAELVRVLAESPLEQQDGKPRGIGLDYGRVIEVLDSLCSSGVIPAQLVLQGAPTIDLLGPMETPDRPEGEDAPPLLERREPPDGDTPPDDSLDDWRRPE